MSIITMISTGITKVITGVVGAVVGAVTAPSIATITTAVVTLGMFGLAIFGIVKGIKWVDDLYTGWENDHRTRSYGNSNGRFKSFKFCTGTEKKKHAKKVKPETAEEKHADKEAMDNIRAAEKRAEENRRTATYKHDHIRRDDIKDEKSKKTSYDKYEEDDRRNDYRDDDPTSNADWVRRYEM